MKHLKELETNKKKAVEIAGIAENRREQDMTRKPQPSNKTEEKKNKIMKKNEK